MCCGRVAAAPAGMNKPKGHSLGLFCGSHLLNVMCGRSGVQGVAMTWLAAGKAAERRKGGRGNSFRDGINYALFVCMS